MAGGGEWQTVKPNKRVKSFPGSGASSKAPAKELKDSAGAAFAQLDADFSKQNGALKINGTSTGQFHSLPVEAAPVESPKAPATPPEDTQAFAKKPAKQKKPKVKKLGTSDIAAQISPDDLKAVLSDFEDKYSSDEHSQLQRVADYIIESFKDADIPFNKTVLEQPIKKAGQVPIADLPKHIEEVMIKFYQKKHVQNMADFLLHLVKVFLNEIPSESGISKNPKKAKVGLLMTISLMLRSRPEALLLLNRELQDNAPAFSTPGRIPFLLWVVQQAASVDLSVAIAVWSRTLLPQILGRPLPTAIPSKSSEALSVLPLSTSSADLAIRFAEDTLREAERSISKPPKEMKLGVDGDFADGKYPLSLTDSYLIFRAEAGITVQADEGPKTSAVVPPETLEAITRICFTQPPAFSSAQTRSRLLSLHSGLKDLVLVGIAKGHTKPSDAVRLVLDSATIAVEEAGPSGRSDDAVDQAASTMIEYIYAEPRAVTSVWEQRHKHHIKGSSAILHYLSSYPPDLQALAKNPARRQLFLDTLRHLKDRHRGLLATGKSWQQNAAQQADRAIRDLTQRILTKQRKGSALNVLLAILIAGLAIVFLARQEFLQDLLAEARRGSPKLEKVVASLEAGLATVQHEVQGFTDSTLGPAFHTAKRWGTEEYDKTLKPAVHSVASSATEQFHTLVQLATDFLQQK